MTATAGDLDALLEMLDPNVVGHTDAGGLLPASRGLIVGRDRVARSLRIRLAPIPVNGEPGALAYQDGRLLAVIGVAIREDGTSRSTAWRTPTSSPMPPHSSVRTRCCRETFWGRLGKSAGRPRRPSPPVARQGNDPARNDPARPA
jgi:hypothetical protein